MPETVERLASMEATLNALKSSQEKMTGYLERSAQERTVQHTETTRLLAVIETNQANVKEELNKYQVECSKDREEMKKEIVIVKKTLTWNGGIVFGASTVISAVIAGAGVLVQWWHK